MNRYYKRKISALPQNAVSLDGPGGAVGEILGRKPRLAILVDQEGWAFHDQALQKSNIISDEWETEIFFLNDKPVIDPRAFDILYNFNHTPSHYDGLFHRRLIKGLYSHYHHTANIPWQYVYRMVRHASALVVANRQQAEETSPFFSNTFELPDSVDTNVFFMQQQRTGKDIVAGWSGNPDRKLAGKRVKRFYEVVMPAAKASGIEIITGRNLGRAELCRMYNSTDLVLIASRSEGNPICFFEAGACGRTVIATAVGVIPQIVEEGIDGFLIDPDLTDRETIRLMTGRLLWCKAHPEETRMMGMRLRDKILNERNSRVAGEAFRTLINKVMYRGLMG